MKNTKRLLCLLLSFIFAISVIGCTKKQDLSVPTNLKITGSIITFDSDVLNLFRIEIENVETGEIIRRYVEDGMDLNSLDIPTGTYKIKIQSVSNDKTNFSLFSDTVTYKQKDLYMIKELKEQKLVDGNYVKWMGRTLYSEEDKTNTLFYSASGFEVKVQKDEEPLTVKTKLHATNTTNSSKRPYIVLVKDNDFENTITLSLIEKESEITLVGDGGFTIDDDEIHIISLYKRSESIDSHVSVENITTNGKFISGVSYKEHKIEVIAASSSTGYGNLGNSTSQKDTSNSDALHAFAFLTAQKLNAEINIVSASGWGISGSRWTSPNTVNMYDKYKYVDVASDKIWDVSNYTPDVIVTNFGTNDLSYINAASNANEKAKRRENFISMYVLFLEYLHNTYPNAKIIILYGLMLESGIYTDTIEIYNKASLNVPSLEIIKIEGDAKGAASHPSKASHEEIATTLTNKIKEIMNW